ncbi:DUF92 domain-containing protein [Enterococcus termitis]|uniref:TIGR00297 family protein n=1 Tax=Enterococcus termitis TaxID=332950 RepID=A0A1E5G978_9ENTE|nr:DUF92 domain-containing protein [Enterococcus termitis]OEG09247.1 hypothetical protein BCR25_11820 [Enterococcus termitis]OJG98714.1 TIGR00297 family protein [Enterococcus termitis]
MTILVYQLLLGFFVSSIISFFSYIYHLLTKSGSLAVITVGTVVCAFGSWQTWVLLILLFGSSGLISILKKPIAISNEETLIAKDQQRDGWQILANGLPAIVSLILFYFTENQLFLIGYVSAIAGATADTWASEIGIVSRHTPRSILSFKPIAPGLSGGISSLGTFASLVGSGLIAGAFWLLSSLSITQTVLFFWIPLICGFANSLIDSILGAAFQVKYRCSICGQITERTEHHQLPTLKLSGLSWLTNDWVNFISGCLTVLLSWLLVYY